MTKINFLMALYDKLSGLPKNEVNERISFYSEMIEDRMEDGLSEEAAVDAVGSVDEIVEQIIGDIPLTKIVKEKIKPKRKLGVLEIILLSLGSPIWVSLLIAAFAVIFSVYVALWSIIISLWSVVVSLCGAAFGGIIGGFILSFTTNFYSGIALISAAIVCSGLSIFAFFGCKMATKGMAFLTKKLGLWIKGLFIKKEVAE